MTPTPLLNSVQQTSFPSLHPKPPSSIATHSNPLLSHPRAHHTTPRTVAMALTSDATTAACIVVLLALAGATGAATPAPAPAPAADCTASLLTLADCLDYVSPGSKSSRPSKTCCGEVKTAVGSPAVVDCLCAAMAAKQKPIPINMTRVLALPTACGASASVLNKCHAVPGGAPTGAPAPSPSSGSGSGSATASPPKANVAARSPGGSATVLLATVATSLLAFYYL